MEYALRDVGDVLLTYGLDVLILVVMEYALRALKFFEGKTLRVS